jgi:Zn-dependent peptidase ImmA (M78 family)
MTFSYTAPEVAALKVLRECGLRDPTEFPLRTIILGRGAYYAEQSLTGKDGEIVTVDGRSIITVNADIPYETRKRFAAAHELGHFEMHRSLKPVFIDTEYDLLDWYRGGDHEQEANAFASEFLMPSEVFYEECKGKRFDFRVIEHVAKRFQVSKTAATLKFAQRGNHPVFVMFCQDNKMKWWRKSEDFYPYCPFIYNKAPFPGTVAAEVFSGKKIDRNDEAKEDIWKSDWFELRSNENDKRFFEYCMFIRSQNSTLSIIWEK